MGKPNLYKPETWKELSEATQVKLAIIKSWIDGTDEDEITSDDWERDF
jgi:hypothetical protein